jgi:molecular chaperone GrpE (heat shock protein)
MNTLENYNITLIDKKDVDFDPTIHEPIEHVVVSDVSENDKVINIIQTGYMSGDVVLRPAKVKVGKYKS